jgi:hypothetical protein
MQTAYELVPMIADIIAAHCPGTNARESFVRACLMGHWDEAESMVEGMLAEPWHLRGYQEKRLGEFLELMKLCQGRAIFAEQDAA